jgi:IPT/TIG domain
VGAAGTILATMNGGLTWSAQSSGSAAYLNAVAFTDAAHGWAVGGAGTILATTNGGFDPVIPKVTSFTPAAGPVGTVVTLTGTNFTGATAVAFHGAAAIYTVVSATQITATVPAGATTGTISATTPGGTGTSAASFTVTVPAGAPTITSFTPAAGPVGTVVTINGTNFSGATAVAFHGTAAVTHAVASATQITVTVPLFTPTVTLKLSGLKRGALRLGRRLTAKGAVTPASLAGSKVTLTVQKKKGARWVKVKRVARTISPTGAYSWKYKPARRGAYRLRATIAKSATHTAAKTKWRTFKVK